MKRDARIGLAVVLVVGLSITLLVARSIHQNGAEAGIGEEPASGLATASTVQAQPVETGATMDRAYDAHTQAILEFQTQHDYAPGPDTEVAAAGSPTRGQDGTAATDLESRTEAASADSSSAQGHARTLPDLGEPPIRIGTQGATTAALPARMLGTYAVAAGDNPWKISARIFGNGKYAQKIVEANPGLNPARLRVGQKINIPAVAQATPRIQLGNAAPARSRSAGAHAVTAAGPSTTGGRVTMSSVAGHPAAPGPNAAQVRTHEIQAGETLGAIAAKHLGSSGPKTVKKLLDANPGIDPRRLKIGYRLKIPAP
jgi:nucleoid-associated protein YgaU